VQRQAGQIHIERACGHIQATKDQSDPVSVLGLDPRRGAGGKEPFESFVPESLDRHIL